MIEKHGIHHVFIPSILLCSHMRVPTFKFVGQISKMKDNRVIWVLKRFHEEIEKFEGKQIRIIIDDEI
jgi:hypothetical protein